MELHKKLKGTMKDGRPVHTFILENDQLKVEVMELGATLVSLQVKAVGNRDIVLGYDTVQGYEEDTASIGATIGRFANRIENGQFTIQGIAYQLEQNDGNHHLHGGSYGAKHKLFTGAIEGNAVSFTTSMKSEDDGYPGNLSLKVLYEIKDRDLIMSYEYSCTEDSVANITNHSYLNLTEEENIYNHLLTLDSKYYTPFGEGQIPDGSIVPVEGTIFDFSTPKLMGEVLSNHYNALANYGYGYDHNFLFDREATNGILRRCGKIAGKDIALEIWSDAPGFQVYTSNFLLLHEGKYKKSYKTHGALCIEPQFIPNDMNLDGFHQSLIRGGEKYTRHIIYRIDK